MLKFEITILLTFQMRPNLVVLINLLSSGIAASQ
jgi:hypothetical protein